MSRKQPFMKFYPADWRADQTLRLVSLAARGLWIECMCIMHEAEPYGHLIVNGRPVTDAQLAALTGTPLDQVAALLTELEESGVFSRNGKGVIYSRRMTRDEKKSKTARKNGKNGGNPTLRNKSENQPSDKGQVKASVKGGDNTQKPEARSQKPEAANAASRAQPLGRKFLEVVGADWSAHEAMGGHYGDVLAWLEEGYTEAEILAVAERRREVGSKSRPLAYAARFMKEEITKLRQGAPEPSFVRREDVMLMDRETALWKARLTVWHSRGHWEANWGPKPGEPGCQVPPKMLNATRGNAAE